MATRSADVGKLAASAGMLLALAPVLYANEDQRMKMLGGGVIGTGALIGASIALSARDGMPVMRWLVDPAEKIKLIESVRVTPAAVRHGLFIGTMALTGATLVAGMSLTGN